MLNKYLFITIFTLFTPVYLFGMNIVAVYPDYFPPYFVKDNTGNTVGLGIDVMKKIADKTDISVKYVPVSGWQKAVQMVKEGKAQVVLDIGVSPERNSYMLYTIPMNKTTMSLMTRKSSDIRSMNDLHGSVVAVHPSGAGYAMIKQMKDVTIMTADNPADLLYFVMSGQADAMLYSQEAINNVMNALHLEKDIRIVTPPVKVIDRAFGVSSTDQELYKKINNAMNDFVGSDEYLDIYKKWYNPHTPITKDTLIDLLLVITALAAAILIVWRYYSLRNASKMLEAANSALKHTQSALDDSELKFIAMAETINDIIWFADADLTELHYVNKAYEKIYGKTVASLYDDPRSYMECIPEDDRKDLLLSKGGKLEPRSNIRHRVINQETGKTHWVQSQYYPYKDDNGDVRFYTGMITDITSIVESENERLLQQQITAQQARFAALGEMVGAISHQWRQPLNTLYLCIQMLEDACEDEEQDKELIHKYISDSMKLIEHMSETIDDFRDFFRNNKKPEPFDVPRTVQHILRMMAPQLKAHNINYHLDCRCDKRSFSCVNNFEPGNPTCQNLVTGIVNEFKHAILNIIQNAREALIKSDNPVKSIYIDMSCNGGKFMITMTDTAGGIDRNIMDKIFEPYITGKDDGTGMGLYMTKMIIEDKMSGKVTAANTETGASFTITLPVTDKTQ